MRDEYFLNFQTYRSSIIIELDLQKHLETLRNLEKFLESKKASITSDDEQTIQVLISEDEKIIQDLIDKVPDFDSATQPDMIKWIDDCNKLYSIISRNYFGLPLPECSS
jgi:light-regulated signal transduction histidine kinase (bacteriophytochrome)